MAANERARKTHEELFPGYVSALAANDPELIETFDNFAFDEVLRHGNLDARTRLMVQLASFIAAQALREYRMMLGAALTVGVTPVEVKEIVYQAVPYVGMAKVFDFVHDGMQKGAIGVNLGRNVWQNPAPVAMAEALHAVIHKEATPQEAAEIYRKAKER